MAACSPTDLIAAAQCKNNLNPFLAEVYKTALYCRWKNNLESDTPLTCDIEELLAESACFMALQIPVLKIIQTQLLCDIKTLIESQPSVTITADGYLDLESATLGVDLTGAILNAGTHGASSGWGVTPDPATDLKVGAHQGDPFYSVLVGAIIYPGTASKSIAINNTATGTYAIMSFSGTHRAVITGGIITPNQASVPFPQLYDLIRMEMGFSGDIVICQLRPGNGTGAINYELRIETNPGGVTTHSTPINVTQGGRYLVVLLDDLDTGISKMNVYNADTGVLVGNVTSPQSTGTPVVDYVAYLKLGNIEFGSSAGISYFKNFFWIYSNLFPFGI